MEKLVLKKSIFVNGEEIKEIPFDFEALTARDKLQVSNDMISSGYMMTSMEETDCNYHLFLFAKAAEKAGPIKIDCSDIMRLSLFDAVAAGQLGRNFTYGG